MYKDLFDYIREKWVDNHIELGDLDHDKNKAQVEACYRERKAIFRMIYNLGMIERLCEQDEDDCEYTFDTLMDHYLNNKKGFE